MSTGASALILNSTAVPGLRSPIPTLRQLWSERLHAARPSEASSWMHVTVPLGSAAFAARGTRTSISMTAAVLRRFIDTLVPRPALHHIGLMVVARFTTRSLGDGVWGWAGTT